MQDELFPIGPSILRPEQYCLGVRPARQMMRSDFALQQKFTPNMWTPGPMWSPPMAAPLYLTQPKIDEADVRALQEYLQSVGTNLVVPPPSSQPSPTPSEPNAEPTPYWNFSMEGASRGTSDGGVSTEVRRGIREYLGSGYTRRNPDGTYEVDNDFAGKWDDEITLFGGKAEHEFFDVSAAEGKISNTIGTISGSALSANANMEGGFTVTNQGASVAGSAKAAGALLEGKIESVDTGAVGGHLEGKVGSAEVVAEGKAEVNLDEAEATLSGKLGAEVNLVEGGAGVEIYITPRRIVGLGVNAVNWAVGTDYQGLSENWDVGLMVGGDANGQVGLGLGAEGELAYRNGRATAELGVNAALGLGGDVKVSAGLVGLDKVWGGVTSVWNSIWE